jgi:hypothetical protein
MGVSLPDYNTDLHFNSPRRKLPADYAPLEIGKKSRILGFKS